MRSTASSWVSSKTRSRSTITPDCRGLNSNLSDTGQPLGLKFHIIMNSPRGTCGVLLWVNTYGNFDPAIPFGGTKISGWGTEWGMQSLHGYLHTKSVWINTEDYSMRPHPQALWSAPVRVTARLCRTYLGWL
jgi:hypothetical protein